ncbi:phosphoribosyltransferase [Thiolapillus sp.]
MRQSDHHTGHFPCELISWDQFDELTLQLVEKITADGFTPDLIVAIARGGYLPARLLSDHLDLFDLDCIRIEHYQGIHKSRQALVRYPLSAEINGRQVLLVDDVSDSGDTFETALEHLGQKGSAAAIRTAVLHHKTSASYRPHYYATEVSEWRWIVYPWAVQEDLRSLLARMQPRPASIDAFARLLKQRHDLELPLKQLEAAFSFNLPDS